MKNSDIKSALKCQGCGTGFGLHEGQCPVCWKAQRDELAHELDMYRRAWIRELGGRLISKTHEIDALVLTTRQLREDTQRETMQSCAKVLYETATRADVVALVEKWSNGKNIKTT